MYFCYGSSSKLIQKGIQQSQSAVAKQVVLKNCQDAEVNLTSGCNGLWKIRAPPFLLSKSHMILGITLERGLWEIQYPASPLHTEETLEDAIGESKLIMDNEAEY